MTIYNPKSRTFEPKYMFAEHSTLANLLVLPFGLGLFVVFLATIIFCLPLIFAIAMIGWVDTHFRKRRDEREWWERRTNSRIRM
jgi:hypothetical protein